MLTLGNAIDSGVIQLEESCRPFSLAEILTATNDFDDALAIGIGGFGKVYKGSINNGTTTVAIKRLKAESKQGEKEFWTEVNMLSKLRHAHLVALIGYCNDSQEMILVYEYIARGNLADHLYKSRDESGTNISPLLWEQRIKICIGAALGLNYLHTGTHKSYIHRDVKTTNILLNENLVAKVSDFGLSKGTTSQLTSHVSTDVKGTWGYLDPDYIFTKRLTTKSDVYAFGVMLLEVLCGRPPVDINLKEEEISLILWAQQCIKKGKLHKLIDPSLGTQITPRSLKYFVELAHSCLHQNPKARPSMALVIGSLQLVLASQQKGRTEGILTKVFQGIGFVAKGTSNDTSQVLNSDSNNRLHDLSLADIRRATNDFDKKHLIHSSKNMYRGSVITDGRSVLVAIKRFKEVTLQEWNEIQPEIMVQTRFRHPHLVTLIGSLYEEQELILVYDYMARGSLRDLLKTKILLMWKKRLEICICAAEGLQYLHMGKVYPNIKLSNIFLDEKLVAKVRDVKFPKMIPTSSSSTCTDASLVWSNYYKWGDLDPKDDLGYGKNTLKHDIYSFGVVLLQVLISEVSLDRFLEVIPGYRKLPLSKLLTKILQLEAIDYVIEPYLIGKISPESLQEYIKIALSCLSEQEVRLRPPLMDYVVESLQSSLQLQQMWETHNQISARYVRYSSIPKYFVDVGQLVRTHAPNNYYEEEGRWGIYFIEKQYF
ncbi:probable serine/threonine-protein kinase PBL18 [Actinidia eriantha]|uniref:probable serine/threonine-protein kinase PBL18 n=1 Tax=Actinidia eriantha TaxID=165200 RepID=UPI002583333E|nr:probable serine/threonine-protein kinase PBL18 [Actinidia eriantha]